MKKKIIGFCVVFLLLSAAMGFTETWPICRRLEFDGADYTRAVRRVEVDETGSRTDIVFYLNGTDQNGNTNEIGVVLGPATSRAGGGNNYNCIGVAAFVMGKIYRNLETSVDYAPGRSYGVVMKDNSGRTVALFLVQK